MFDMEAKCTATGNSCLLWLSELDPICIYCLGPKKTTWTKLTLNEDMAMMPQAGQGLQFDSSSTLHLIIF